MDPDLVGIGNETWVHGQEGKKKLKQKKKQISKSDRDGGRKNKRKGEDEMEEGKRARMRIQDKSLSLRLNKAGEKVFREVARSSWPFKKHVWHAMIWLLAFVGAK